MNQKEKIISNLIHYLFPGVITMLSISDYGCEIVFKDGDVVILDIGNDIIPWLNAFRHFICTIKGDCDD